VVDVSCAEAKIATRSRVIDRINFFMVFR